MPAARQTRRATATPETIADAAAELRAGHLVAFPTETVYGLGADATSPAAVASVYAAKERPSGNPLIAHVATLQAALAEGIFSTDARALAERFWPGPLTLVVPVAATGAVCSLARAGLDSVALRLPSFVIAWTLIAAAGRPIVAPSANRSGRVSPTTADHVCADLDGRIDLVLDGGAAPLGVESTVVACLDDEPRILRPGSVTREALEQALGRTLPMPEGIPDTLRSPGMLASHYAPRAMLRLGAVDVRPGEAVLDFGGRLADRCADAPAYRDLSAGGDPADAASNLYGYLRDLDATGVAVIAVAPIPPTDLGEAVNDRLARAAAPRAG